MARGDGLVQKGRTWWFRRRVPERYRSVERRLEVSCSLKTDSRIEAERKAVRVWEEFEAGWEARLAGHDLDAEKRFDAARRLAEAKGFRYRPMRDIASGPFEEMMRRLEAIPVQNGAYDPVAAAALLGVEPEPKIKVSRALELFWDISKADLIGKSDDQKRRWRNPRIKAVRNFIDVVGDRALDEINRADMRDFHDWWRDRIEAGEVQKGSANKDFTHFRSVISRINEEHRLGLDIPFHGLSFKGEHTGKRPAFSEGWIKNRLLAPGALDGLNPQARAIFLTMVNTGLRPSEIAGLTGATIHLDGGIPFVEVAPTDREVKSRRARRKLPLVGVSLEAVRAFPDGFPRYRDSAEPSAAINKYLREAGLRETEDHTMYSLRHSFQDRIRRAGALDRVQKDMMGHRLSGEDYGEGANLAEMLAVLDKIAY